MNYVLVNGEPVQELDIVKWARWMESADEERRIAFDEFGEVEVSTVFLGLDHQFGDGLPLLYETMIFGGDHNDYQQRYSTKEEALIGHREAVELVNK